MPSIAQGPAADKGAPPAPAASKPLVRPVGITMIGLIALFGGALAATAAFAAFLFLVLGAGLGNALGAILGVFALVLLVVSVGLGLVGLITGWGVLKGRAWARILLLVLLVLNAMGGLSAFLAGGDGAVGLVSVAVSGIVGWYLFRPEVKAWFAPR